MPASSGTLQVGTTFSYSATQNGSYAPIAQAKDLKGPGIGVSEVEITNNDSPSNAREFMPGMVDPGKLSGKLIFKNATLATFAGLIGGTYYWKAVYPNGFTWGGNPGFITKLDPGGGTPDAIEIDFEIKLTGPVTYAAAS